MNKIWNYYMLIVIIHIFGNCSANFAEYLLKHFPEIRFHCRKKGNRLEMAETKTVCKIQFRPENELRNRRSMGAFSSSRWHKLFHLACSIHRWVNSYNENRERHRHCWISEMLKWTIAVGIFEKKIKSTHWNKHWQSRHITKLLSA